MIIYIESSATEKLIHDEVETTALRTFLDDLDDDDELVGSVLVETELRRAATRLGVDQRSVTDVLQGMSLLAMPRSLFAEAGLLPHAIMRSLDALHVTSALRASADLLISYDHRILAAAEIAGLNGESPA